MKTIKQAQIKSETEKAVDAYLTEIGVAYSVQGAGVGMKRDGWECDGWRAAFTKGDLREEFDFYTGTGHRVITGRPIDPNINPRSIAYGQWERANVRPFAPFAASVLCSLVLDSSAADQSFRNWCADLGYDSDSIKALNTYNACCDIAEKLLRIFTREQINHISEILQDY